MVLILLNLIFLYPSMASTVIKESELEKLIEANPKMKVLEMRLEGAKALQGNLTRSFLPKVSLSYGAERFTTGPYRSETQPFGGITAEMNLFNFGKDKLESKKRDKHTEVAQIDALIIRSQLLAELKRAMSHYAYIREIREITQAALDQNEENLKRANKRIEAGLASSTDLLDFKQQKIQFTQEISALEYDLGVTQRLVNTLLGEDPSRDIVIEFSNSHPEHSDDSKFVPQSNSLLTKKFFLESEVKELEYEKDRRWWTPSLDVYAYAQRFTQKEREYTPSHQRNDVTFGFRFTFPVFDGGESYQGAKATLALVEATRNQLRGEELDIERQSLDATKRLELAHKLIHGAEENVKIMQDYRRGILSEYSKGVKNSPDVLQASQRWVEAKIRNAEVKKNYQFAKVEAEYLVSLQE